jgi:hypothetical protein
MSDVSLCCCGSQDTFDRSVEAHKFMGNFFHALLPPEPQPLPEPANLRRWRGKSLSATVAGRSFGQFVTLLPRNSAIAIESVGDPTIDRLQLPWPDGFPPLPPTSFPPPPVDFNRPQIRNQFASFPYGHYQWTDDSFHGVYNGTGGFAAAELSISLTGEYDIGQGQDDIDFLLAQVGFDDVPADKSGVVLTFNEVYPVEFLNMYTGLWLRSGSSVPGLERWLLPAAAPAGSDAATVVIKNFSGPPIRLGGGFGLATSFLGGEELVALRTRVAGSGPYCEQQIDQLNGSPAPPPDVVTSVNKVAAGTFIVEAPRFKWNADGTFYNRFVVATLGTHAGPGGTCT